jgi:hypothetical protein
MRKLCGGGWVRLLRERGRLECSLDERRILSYASLS